MEYNTYILKARARMGKIRAQIENQFDRRVSRQRPVDPHKEALLTAMDKKRRKKMIRDGSLILRTPHHVILRVFYEGAKN